MKKNRFDDEQALLRTLEPAPNFMFADVLKAIREVANVTPRHLQSYAREYLLWRRRAPHLAHNDLGYSCTHIGKVLDRDHTSVRYSLKKYDAENDVIELDRIRLVAKRAAQRRLNDMQAARQDFEAQMEVRAVRQQAARVIIESPYAGRDVEANVRYARRCLKDSLDRGESPFASHLLYTQVLDDNYKHERQLGMQRAFAWYANADYVAVYTDRGISNGMRAGMSHARSLGLKIHKRQLDI